MKKKIVSLSLALMILVTLIPNVTSAQQDIKIIVNGKEIKTDVAPYIEKGYTMVPIRFISEALGGEAEYQDGIVYVSLPESLSEEDFGLALNVGSPVAFISQSCWRSEAPTVIKNGRTFVPLRFIATYFGCTTTWDENSRTITIEQNIPYNKDLFIKTYHDEKSEKIMFDMLENPNSKYTYEDILK